MDKPTELLDASEAYDMVDRYLRNNLDDSDYATFSDALELVRTNAYAEGRKDEQEELSSVLPGVTYMDPPDGGAPTVLEQLQRQAKDAARYLWLRNYSVRYAAPDDKPSPWPVIGTSHDDSCPCDGSDLDEAADAAMNAGVQHG
jgi:hypothetical protein